MSQLEAAAEGTREAKAAAQNLRSAATVKLLLVPQAPSHLIAEPVMI
uniref:Uncharacterized protein n=1 Tax=Rhizophora mucronata TaxID=61149 RepID=A0A2P2J5P8_RHIMU